MKQTDGPALVCMQAGNLHSGAFDPFDEAIAIAHERGAWVHVDGAFGLWAAASPLYRDQVAGLSSADSWATDAHKTLNVPYDCGVAIVSQPEFVRAAFGMHTDYLITDEIALLILSKKFLSSHVEHAEFRSGRRCDRLVGQELWRSWKGSVLRPRFWPKSSRLFLESRCSTM